MSSGLCLIVTFILDLSGNSWLLQPRKALQDGTCLWLGTSRAWAAPVAPASWRKRRGVQNGVATAGDSPGQHLPQLGLSQEEIRLVISSPHHPVCQSRSAGMQFALKPQAALAPGPWSHHQILGFLSNKLFPGALHG